MLNMQLSQGSYSEFLLYPPGEIPTVVICPEQSQLEKAP